MRLTVCRLWISVLSQSREGTVLAGLVSSDWLRIESPVPILYSKVPAPWWGIGWYRAKRMRKSCAPFFSLPAPPSKMRWSYQKLVVGRQDYYLGIGSIVDLAPPNWGPPTRERDVCVFLYPAREKKRERTYVVVRSTEEGPLFLHRLIP